MTALNFSAHSIYILHLLRCPRYFRGHLSTNAPILVGACLYAYRTVRYSTAVVIVDLFMCASSHKTAMTCSDAIKPSVSDYIILMNIIKMIGMHGYRQFLCAISVSTRPVNCVHDYRLLHQFPVRRRNVIEWARFQAAAAAAAFQHLIYVHHLSKHKHKNALAAEWRTRVRPPKHFYCCPLYNGLVEVFALLSYPRMPYIHSHYTHTQTDTNKIVNVKKRANRRIWQICHNSDINTMIYLALIRESGQILESFKCKYLFIYVLIIQPKLMPVCVCSGPHVITRHLRQAPTPPYGVNMPEFAPML